MHLGRLCTSGISPNCAFQLGREIYILGGEKSMHSKFCVHLPPFVIAEWGKMGKGVKSPLKLDGQHGESGSSFSVPYLKVWSSVSHRMIYSFKLRCDIIM